MSLSSLHILVRLHAVFIPLVHGQELPEQDINSFFQRKKTTTHPGLLSSLTSSQFEFTIRERNENNGFSLFFYSNVFFFKWKHLKDPATIASNKPSWHLETVTPFESSIISPEGLLESLRFATDFNRNRTIVLFSGYATYKLLYLLGSHELGLWFADFGLLVIGHIEQVLTGKRLEG